MKKIKNQTQSKKRCGIIDDKKAANDISSSGACMLTETTEQIQEPKAVHQRHLHSKHSFETV